MVKIPHVTILGTKVSILRACELNAALGEIIQSGGKELILNVNTHGMNLAYQLPWYQNFVNSAPIVFCDGAGVMLGARILGHRIPERITYAEWMWQLAEFSEPREFSFYFLGGKHGVAQLAADKLREKYPNLEILGIEQGYFNQTSGSPENESVIRRINATKPNILLVGFGMPAQEHWLMENWDRIDANVALTGGGAFDIFSGVLKRGPRWMTDHGLEWLTRLFIEPKRLWKRYLIGNPVFIWRVILERLGLLSFEEETIKR